jgi:hypothetical protein
MTHVHISLEQEKAFPCPAMSERCELGHLHYGEEEIEMCDCSHGRSVSAPEMPTDDFWNMTLDDLEHIAALPQALDRRSSTSHVPEEVKRPIIAARRHSDGMLRMGDYSVRSALRTKSRALPDRNVSFGSVAVRVCERVLGDNPACHDGPSLSIGWNYEPEKIINVEVFESARQKERRSYDKLCLSPEKREKIAMRSGYTRQDIEDNVKQMHKYQRRRERTRKEVEGDSLASLLKPMSSSKRASLAKFFEKHRSSSSKASKAGPKNGLSLRSI